MMLAMSEEEKIDSEVSADVADTDTDEIKESTIETPPEIAYYKSEYDVNDKKLESYLSEKYAEEIAACSFFPKDILVRFVLGYKHVGYDAKTQKSDYNARQKETDRIFGAYMKFHKRSDYDNITSKLSEEEILQTQSDQFYYAHDKYGHPVIYNTGVRYRTNGDLSIFKGKGKDELNYQKIDEFLAYTLKVVHELKVKNSKKYLNVNAKSDVGVYQMCAVIDLTEMSMRHMFKERTVLEYLVRGASEITPDTLHRVYFINAPKLFSAVWKVFKNFVHPSTVEKTVICRENYLEELQKDIDIDMIPKQFGGKGKWPVKYGHFCEGFYDKS